MLVTNKMNSKRQQIKKVNRFGASVTVCVFA